MRNQVEERFSQFYEKWVWKLEEILHQLLEVSKHGSQVVLVTEQDLQALVSTVTTHLKEYYTVKWATAREDVLAFYHPVWMSPLENAYAWVTGWKPSTVFRLLDSLNKPSPAVEGPSTFNMTEEQQRKVEELRIKIRMEEEKVEREMERLQVAMADRKMVELAKLSSRALNGHDTATQVDGLVEVALKGVMSGLEKLMKGADCVRLKTLKGVLDVLTPMQCAEFLAATLTLQLRLRQWGKKKDMASPKQNEDK